MAQYTRGNETVFETPDVKKESDAPNTSTTSITAEGAKDATENIDSAHIDPSRAFEVFQGKVFTLPANEYSLADTIERRVESPLQRFVRLRQELSELKSDLDVMTSGPEDKRDSSVWAVLQKEAGKMVTELQNMEIHSVLKRESTGGSSRITSELKDLAATCSTPVPEPATLPSVLSDNGAALEQRIFALETLLGSSANILDIEGVVPGREADCGVYPLADCLARMEKRVAMLDVAAIDGLRAASAALRADLEATGREKSKNLGPEHKVIESIARLDDMYKKFQLAEGVAQDLPTLIIRLKTLQRLHSETADFSARVAALESSVNALAVQNDSNAAVLQDVKEGLVLNISTMLSNIEEIDKRILDLKSNV